MKRRQFIALLGAGWPLAARAQQGERMRRIGVLSNLVEEDPQMKARFEAFQQGLEKLGWLEGRNVRVDRRFGVTEAEQIEAQAKELLALQPDVPVRSAKAATSTIPIVFTIARDPVQLGLVESLNRPGGNMTGAYLFIASLEGKRLGLLREVVPTAPLIAVLLNPTFENEGGQLKGVQEAAATLGQAIKIVHATNEREIDAAFATAVQQGPKRC